MLSIQNVEVNLLAFVLSLKEKCQVNGWTQKLLKGGWEVPWSITL
jgi:hypothetical protein